MTRIVWNPEVRSFEDAIVKIMPPEVSTVGGLFGGDLLGEKRKKEQELQQVESKLEEAEKQKEASKQRQEAIEENTEKQPPEATSGAEITGFKGGEQVANPTEQPGTMTTAPPKVPVSKSFFRDEFGISGSDLIDMLHKAGESHVVPSVVELLRLEQQAVLKQFDWWQDDDWDLLQLHDNDFNVILNHPDRLEYQLRKTVAKVKKASDEDVDGIWKEWHDRLNAEMRLSRRERNLLEKSHEVLRKNGDMNASNLTSYGIDATPSELAGLIKTYGWLYDTVVVGKGTTKDNRTLQYGTTKPPIFLKHVDSFIGNLWEVGGNLELLKNGTPRLTLPFDTKRGEDYANVLKSKLDVERITWEGRQFVLEGESAIFKAAKEAMPYLTIKKADAAIVVSALEGDENAGRVLAFDNSNKDLQVELMKSWNASQETVEQWRRDIVNEC
tara:strand:+ start:3479 stop:4801 length:1323 start_codon:yes stop_codon:yes gene_type:complete